MITIHSGKEIAMMRVAGKMAAELLNHIADLAKEGVSTQFLDDEADRWVKERGATNAPLNYNGYSKSICTSINEVVCHGFPSENTLLKNGDIINIDVSPKLNGFIGDTSKTLIIGSVSPKTESLVRTCEECLYKAIEVVAPGNYLGDIGYAIQSLAESRGFSVVRDFVGHGVGRVFHSGPQVCHYGNPKTGLQLRENMIFTIEPMINEGGHQVKILDDDWTAITVDGSNSAQFEHTILVTKNGYEILTKI